VNASDPLSRARLTADTLSSTSTATPECRSTAVRSSSQDIDEAILYALCIPGCISTMITWMAEISRMSDRLDVDDSSLCRAHLEFDVLMFTVDSPTPRCQIGPITPWTRNFHQVRQLLCSHRYANASLEQIQPSPLRQRKPSQATKNSQTPKVRPFPLIPFSDSI
jgi:hypothetical protein